MNQSIYITTAIDYPNSLPHIGTAYEKIGADALARFLRLSGFEVRLQMGNDEHSVKVKKVADEKGLDALAYCSQMRDKFVEAWDELNIDYTDFIQTTEERNKAAVQKLFEKVFNNGDIYQGTYEGWYCEGCEAYYTDKDLENGLCPAHQAKPKWLEEKNYFFKLSQYSSRIKDHIQKNPEFILPEVRRNEVLSFLENGLEDISVTRPNTGWGVSLKNDPNQFVYVWFDALINYLAGVDYSNEGESYQKWWPAHLHIIGKDITRFHCIIWPAMLMSAGIALPKSIFAHGFVYLKGEKMSKTLGNILNPMDVIKKYGADSLRYYLLRESSFGSDSNFTWENFIKRYNSDLANDIGNMLNRTLGMAKKYFESQIDTGEHDSIDQALLDQALKVGVTYKEHMNYQKGDLNYHLALASLWELIAAGDKYINDVAPWTLKKEGKDARLKGVLVTLVKVLRLLATYVQPFLPNTSEKMFSQLKMPVPSSFVEAENFDQIKLPHQLGNASPLFPRIEVE